MKKIVDELDAMLSVIDAEKNRDTKIELINYVKIRLHEVSPFAGEPVDCVLWKSSDTVEANDYNPNSVAPPEMRLLEHSIAEDGYTQPIVAWDRDDGVHEVVDGFHRHRVGKESKVVKKRVKGYLPIVAINENRQEINNRMASTIRHNRARGKHQVEGMSDIVIELKRRNWSNERIGRELGMDQDEILRLCQITGLSELFADQQFSKAWDVEGAVTEDDFVELSDDVSTYGEQVAMFRTVNTSDETRVFHTFDKWECHKAGFYDGSKEGMTKAECEEVFRSLLADIPKFTTALAGVISDWPNSCEHYLTNASMNRIAWMGQAAVCFATGIPSAFRSGWFLLSEDEKAAADTVALTYLNKWMCNQCRPQLTMDEAKSGDRQSMIY
jgi:ParB-like chromosome segregation protein Spo0J